MGLRDKYVIFDQKLKKRYLLCEECVEKGDPYVEFL